MSEKFEENAEDVEINNLDITFDNLIIVKEFGNIVNLVRNEDFLETVPKAKLRRVKWMPMFNCLKQGIFDEMVKELTLMWNDENMPDKIERLEKQKEKFAEINENRSLWRPELADVKAQLRASDVANLQKQKILLESLAKEYDLRVNRLKNVLSAKRHYLKSLHRDIQQYQKKNEEFITKMNENFENHEDVMNTMLPDFDIEENTWMEDNKIKI